VEYIEGDLKILDTAKRPDSNWAYDVCKTSRSAHIHVWYERPENAVVFRLIRVLESLREKLQALQKRLAKGPPKKAEDVSLYARNVRTRINSLNNYIKGLLPILPEDAAEDEKEMARQAALRYEVAKGKVQVDVAKTLKRYGFLKADDWCGFTAKVYGTESTVPPHPVN